jgi:hypothetical protein
MNTPPSNASTSNTHSSAFAEIIESSLTHCVAQCWDWETMPRFGQFVLVNVGEEELIGIVSDIKTGSMDPTRYPFPYQKTHAELRTQHPQIFEFLKTIFHITMVGSIQGTRKRYALPAQPAKIHTFVGNAATDQLTPFLQSSAFLPLLLSGNSTPQQSDELFLAVVDELARIGLLTTELFEQYYHTYSLLIGNDYRRLKVLLQRIAAHHAQALTTHDTLSGNQGPMHD